MENIKKESFIEEVNNVYETVCYGKRCDQCPYCEIMGCEGLGAGFLINFLAKNGYLEIDENGYPIKIKKKGGDTNEETSSDNASCSER